MSFSTDTFDLLFDQLQFARKRTSRIARNYERAEGRIADLLEQPQSTNRDSKLESIRDIQLWRLEKSAKFTDDITRIEAVLPKDEFSVTPKFEFDEITGKPSFITFDITIKDSLYDDTYVAGDNITVSSVARGPGKKSGRRSWRRTVKLLDESVVDGTTETAYGSNYIAKQWNMGDTFKFQIWSDAPRGEGSEVVYEQKFDPLTYFDTQIV